MVTGRGAVARLAAGVSLALGTFGVMLAWTGPLRLSSGDVAICIAAGCAAAAVVLARWLSSAREVVAMALTASLLTGAVVGAVAMGAPRVPMASWLLGAGVAVWLGAAIARAGCALPLLLLLRRGAALASQDALDRVMLASSLWLVAALTEAALVVRYVDHFYVGMSGPVLGPTLLSLMLLSGLSALAALVRSLWWLALWRRVQRGDGWRVVEAAAWSGPVPEEPWFNGAGEGDAVVVRTVAREGRAYRDGDLEVAHTRAPGEGGGVTLRLVARAAAATALLAGVAGVSVVWVARLRW